MPFPDKNKSSFPASPLSGFAGMVGFVTVSQFVGFLNRAHAIPERWGGLVLPAIMCGLAVPYIIVLAIEKRLVRRSAPAALRQTRYEFYATRLAALKLWAADAAHSMAHPFAGRSWQQIASFPVAVIMLCLFGYGFGAFFDGPYKPCDRPLHYCGKTYDHSEAEYTAYNSWSRTILIVWPLGLATLWLLNRKK